MTARDLIAQALALSAVATDGPWHEPHDDGHGCVYIGDYGWVAYGPTGQGPAYDEDTDQGRADAEFIAHARTLLPAFAKALGGVLDLHARDLDESPDYEERLWDQGFNAALGDAHAAITAALSEVTL